MGINTLRNFISLANKVSKSILQAIIDKEIEIGEDDILFDDDFELNL